MFVVQLAFRYTVQSYSFGGDLASTRVTKPKGHAEEQYTSLIQLQPKLVANDDNYALAA